MENSILTSVILPASLFIIMLGMGLSLVVDDFKRVAKYPKATFIGLFNQLILLPIIAFIIVTVLDVSPMMAVGFMLVAACPGGVTSNLISHVSKGDTALSITLTAISSFITVITIPIIVSFSIYHFLEDTATLELPLLETIIQILGITIIPVSLGMFINYRYPKFAKKMDKPTRIGSTVIFVAIIFAIVLGNLDVMEKYLFQLGWISLLLNVSMMFFGFYSAKILKLKLPQSISIAVETGIQNATLAIVIATSILEQPDLAIPAAVYGLLMFISGGFMMWYFGRREEVESVS